MSDYKYSPFPDDNVSPEKKNEADWCLEYCKAAWYHAETYLPSGIFYKAKDKYDKVRQYMNGRQPIDDYKKAMHVDEETDETMFPLDFTVLSIVPNRRLVALGKMMQREYRPVAIPVDSQAKDELDQWYADMKAKLAIREQVAQTNPELLQSPELALDVNDPQDLEELEMEMEYGSKRKRSKEAELAIRAAFFWNKVPENLRPEIFENLFDHGVGVYADDLSKGNKPKARAVDLRRFITNYCRRKDFSDMKFAGEVYEMTIDEYEREANVKLSEEEKMEIIGASQKVFGGPSVQTINGVSNRNDDRFKVTILDLKWFSTNTIVNETRTNKFGNEVTGYAPFEAQGEKYERETYRAIYQGKWVVGTDHIFDFGMAYDQKRGFENWHEAKLPYHVCGVNNTDMEVYALGEKLIPLADAVQIAWMKIQSIRAQMIPNGFDIDLDALEDAAIGKGGKVLNKRQVLELFFQTGMLISRRRDISERNVNYKAIQYIENSFGKALAEAWNDFAQNVNLIREITGFNELTDGSTPNPKTLVPVAKMAYEATNNALYGIISAEKKLLFSLGEAMVTRTQQAIRRGPVEGYINAFGKATVEYVRISPNIDNRDYAIMLEDIPSDEQRQVLREQLLTNQQKNLLTPADVIYILSIDNLKQAEEVMAYRVKKREDELHQREMQKITENHKGQQESNLLADKLAKETAVSEHNMAMEKDRAKYDHEEKMKKMDIDSKEKIASQKPVSPVGG